jgi:predicted phage tail protein
MPILVRAPTNLSATIMSIPGPLRISLNWTDNSGNENNFAVWGSDNGGVFAQIGTVPRTAAQSLATGGTVTFVNTNAIAPLVIGHTYMYYVTAVNNTLGASTPSNTVTVLFAAPAAPSNLNGTAVRITGNNVQDRVNLTWTDNSINELNFEIQRATNSAFTTGLATFTVGANVVTFTQLVPRTPRPPGPTYWYRIRATNLVGNSAWNTFGPLGPVP